MIDCRRVVHAWAYRDEWADIEITLTADSGESAAARIASGHEARYTLTRVSWTAGRQAYASAILGQGEGTQEYQRLRSLGALDHMRWARGLQDVMPRRRSPEDSQAAVPPPEVAVVVASPAAPEGDDFTAEAIDQLDWADKGGAR